jgi:undecaprenyl-diphosphatase
MRPIICWVMAFLSVALIAGAFVFDDETAAWVKSVRTKPGKQVAGQISEWGDAPPLIALSVIGFGVAAWRRNDRWRRLFAAMLIAGCLAGLGANVIRITAGRTRPNAKVEQGWYGPYHDGTWLVCKNKFNSFPSGHTSMAFGFFAVLAMGRRWAWAAAGLAAAAAVGASRVYLGVHHLSDVTVGMLLGCWVAWWVWPRVERWCPRGRGGLSEISSGLPKARGRSYG